MPNFITIKNKLTGEIKKVEVPSALQDEWKVWGAVGGTNHKAATQRLKTLGVIENGMIVIKM